METQREEGKTRINGRSTIVFVYSRHRKVPIRPNNIIIHETNTSYDAVCFYQDDFKFSYIIFRIFSHN